MSSGVAVLLGVQQPRVRLVPKAADNDFLDAVFLAGSYGLVADEWQESVLEGWLGIRPDKKWAAPRCGLAVPRQNGKNAVVEIRELHGMVSLGEKWLHTAHEVKTARKAFTRLLSFFDNERRYPELFALVEDIRKTNGQEAIILTNGGSVEFAARSKNSGRGYTVDVLLCDEAQELSDEALEALLPTISAAPLGNPQQIYTGTPPGPKAVGEVFTRIRQLGVEGKDRRLCWLEWGCVPENLDVDDRDNWSAANPALGIRLHLDTITDERATFDTAGFARERLGVWDDPDSLGRVISPALWSSCRQNRTKPEDLTLAIDVSPTQTWAAIAAAWIVEGVTHVEVTGARDLDDHLEGTAWIVPRVTEIIAKHKARVTVASNSQAAALVPDLERAGVTVDVIRPGDVTSACGAFYNLATDGRLAHHSQDPLDKAVANAQRKDVGDGAWIWGRRKSPVDITPLYAATLAAWQVGQPGEPEPAFYSWAQLQDDEEQ